MYHTYCKTFCPLSHREHYKKKWMKNMSNAGGEMGLFIAENDMKE